MSAPEPDRFAEHDWITPEVRRRAAAGMSMFGGKASPADGALRVVITLPEGADKDGIIEETGPPLPDGGVPVSIDADWLMDHGETVRLSIPKSLSDAPAGDRPREIPVIRDAMIDAWDPRGLYPSVAAFNGQDGEIGVKERWDARTLPQARMLWVSDSLLDLVDDVRFSVPDDLSLAEAAPLYESGMVVFQHALVGVSAKPRPDDDRPAAVAGVPSELMVKAMVWGPIRTRSADGTYSEGIGLSSYALVDNFAPHLGGGRLWVPLGRSDWYRTEPVGDCDWTLGFRQDIEIEHPGLDRAMFAASAADDRRTLTAIWQVARLERHVERRTYEPKAKNKKRVKDARSTVEVIHLRRPEGDTPRTRTDDDGGRESRYTCQWWVGPHLRWQPYGKDRAFRRLTPIDGYMKGDPSMPFRPKHRVIAVDR